MLTIVLQKKFNLLNEKKGKKMKRIITLSAFAALTTSSLLAADVDAKLSEMEAKITKLEESLSQAKKTLNEVKAHDGNDNIKFDVDFRTSVDSIHYKTQNGSTPSNPDLLTNRLWLGMGFAPTENTMFKGKLSYLKAYGDSASHQQSNIASGSTNLQGFDWVTNENAGDNTLKVKEAYWLYKNTIGESVPYTVSIGRRPSTDGLGINLREGMKDNSPLSHTVNVEFDGLSSKFDLDKVTGIKGMWWKLCTGRGLTNATPRFDMTNAAYASADKKDDSITKDVNMYGFIFVPYDNGQYSVHTNWARAEHMIGFDMGMSDVTGPNMAGWSPATSPDFMTFSTVPTMVDANMDGVPDGVPTYTMLPSGYKFKDFGSLDLATVMVKAEGLGDGISDYLDNSVFFASWAQSKTKPKNGMMMLGSPDSQTGTSIWLGANMPCLLTEDGRIGIEWNKGSKYWRSVTYGEDTMAGSKIAARGTAIEVYYNKPIDKALSFNIRYTKIKYDYAGSNAFFGEDGTPLSMAEASWLSSQLGMADPVTEATDLRASISYRF
jgi:hypothetical protein